MKLRQGQIWKTDERFIRIVSVEQLSVGYKSMADLEGAEGSLELERPFDDGAD
jgi:hypothetical protein